jgi:16S rRNA (guanine966-N2)-methyltransferase
VREPDITIVTRIIAGSRGGRRLVMPTGDHTRPTTDRVREALFSAITAWAGRAAVRADEALAGLSFCDLFAGSGAVGLEAASRGAAPVLLVERSRRAAAVATRNARTLDLPVRVVTDPVERWVGQPADQCFDVVFADPPYELATAAVADLLAALLDNGWSAASGLMVVERSSRSEPIGWPAGMRPGRTRSYGETVLHFAER